MKIIYVVTKGQWGGAQKYVYDLATILPQTRFTTKVIVGQGDRLSAKLTAIGVPCHIIECLGRDVNFINDLRTGWMLYKFFKTEKPDVIHLNSSKVGFIGALAGRLARAPKIIFTAHGWAFNEDRPWLWRAATKLLHWLTVLATHQTIVVSLATQRQLANWPGVKQKMTVIHNGIKPIDFKERDRAREILLGARAAEQTGLWIGTISELHKNKGLSYLLSALAILMSRLNLDNGRQGLALVAIIGEGEERKNLEKQIAALGLQNTVFLIGHKDNAAALLPAFNIFTLTSITEAFPYVLLEAGLAGLPVVASAVGGIPEIIASMESGILIKARQPSEIAKAIQFLIEQPEKRRKFGSKLRQKIRREFSTARMVKQTIAVYNSVK